MDDPNAPQSDTTTLQKLVEELRMRGRERFLAAYSVPALYARDVGGDEDGSLRFATKFVGQQELGGQSHAQPSSGDPQFSEGSVLFIRKRGAAFPDRIGVGRTRNADVTVPLSRMSKYHAFFSVDAAGSYLLTDARSKNGTFVNGEKLKPLAPHPVEDRDEIRFAEYVFVLYTPDALVKALQSYL